VKEEMSNTEYNLIKSVLIAHALLDEPERQDIPASEWLRAKWTWLNALVDATWNAVEAHRNAPTLASPDFYIKTPGDGRFDTDEPQ
jgi:hypothetical protein